MVSATTAAKVCLVMFALYSVAQADIQYATASALFGYDDKERSIPGPSLWGNLPYSRVCADGKRQSPIDVPSPSPVSRTNGPLTVAYKPSLVHIANNGHSFTITSRGGYLEHSMIFVQNLIYAPLGYRLFQIHFHWGYNNTDGSEHTINGRHYPLEAHLVHYNSRFASIDAAVRSNEPDALIVVAVFFDIGKTTPPSLQTILEKLPYFRGVGHATEIEEYIDLADLYPGGLEYFTYLGSFTNPRCNESNRWIVLARPVSITQEALDHLRTVHITLSLTRTGPGRNVRPVQPLNGRKVTCSFSTLPPLRGQQATATPTPTPTPTPEPENADQAAADQAAADQAAADAAAAAGNM